MKKMILLAATKMVTCSCGREKPGEATDLLRRLEGTWQKQEAESIASEECTERWTFTNPGHDFPSNKITYSHVKSEN